MDERNKKKMKLACSFQWYQLFNISHAWIRRIQVCDPIGISTKGWKISFFYLTTEELMDVFGGLHLESGHTILSFFN